MSSLRHPVGPQPPQVYWRRRAVVGLGVLAVIIIIVLIIVRPGSGAPADEGADPAPASSEPAAEPGASEPPASAGPPVACTDDQIEVVPVTDADAYGPEQQPLISLTIRNVSETACIIQAGSDVQELIITSGEDRIWSSRDCQENPVAAEIVIEPGTEQSTPPIPWNRTRSAPGCEGDRPSVTAGGATYRLAVAVGEFASDSDKPFILN